MKFLTFHRCLPLLLLGGLSFSPAAHASAATVATVARLGGDPDGYHPRAPLVDNHDGYFYGTTEAGGPGNFGTIFKAAPDGTFATIYTFTGGDDGLNPVAGLVAGGDGNLYGATTGLFPLSGGSDGTIFRVTPSGTLTILHRFSAVDASVHNSDGALPTALTRGTDGNLYGVTRYGGATGGGTAFRVTTGGDFAVLASFDTTSQANAAAPTTALAQGPDGNFYGITFSSGPFYAGGFYRITPGGTLTTLHLFDGSRDGSNPDSALTLGADGNFYGTTYSTLYQVTPGGVVTTIHTFASATEGSNPSALVAGTDGFLYGTTNTRGPSGHGTFFRATTAGALTVIATQSGGGELGYQPNALVQGSDGNFYGTMTDGGNGSAGSVFALTPAGAPTTLHLFNAGGSASKGRLLEMPDGTLFGTTLGGGTTGAGTIFSCTRVGAVLTKHSFDASTEGAAPAGGLVRDDAGNIFGTTSQGGPMNANNGLSRAQPAGNSLPPGGGWFEYNPSSLTEVGFFPLYGFDVSYGAGPGGELIIYLRVMQRNRVPQADAAPDPTVFYGVTRSGGDNNLGTVYSITADGTHAILHQFGDQAGDGAGPSGGLTEGTDGVLYGTTTFQGTGGAGTVFSVTTGGVFTTLHAFAATDPGAYPAAALVQGSDGAFYGTTQFTGASTGNGSIFRITPAGAFTTVHAFATDGSEGGQPTAPMMLAGDGNLYGVASVGGDSGKGTVFSVRSDGTFTNLYSFGASLNDGRAPAAALIQGSDGHLYGTTEYGGTDDCGTIFQVGVPSLHPAFFDGAAALANGVYYLSFPSGNPFGYYSFLTDPNYLYHFDLGYEYVFDAADGQAGVYLYDFTSNSFFYTSPAFPFPYLYDFSLGAVLYYYPDPNDAGHYNTGGIRYFFDFATGEIISL